MFLTAFSNEALNRGVDLRVSIRHTPLIELVASSGEMTPSPTMMRLAHAWRVPSDAA
jgi:hypothetical protein